MENQTEKSKKNTRGSISTDNTVFNLLQANDFVAEGIRKIMKEKNILLINVVSSPGSGKTSLMQETIKLLSKEINIAVLVGDVETERDADRIKSVGGNALQITTGGICHLEGQMILQALDNINLEGVDVLFIENVGNLLCPASFDLGEDYRVTLISCTEGDDKPKKYPRMFLTSELMLVTKCDLLPYVPFSVDAVIKDARDINPTLDVLCISSLSQEGLTDWSEWLKKRIEQKKMG